MSADEPEFNDCPAGKEVESFHERIYMELLDAFSELEGRY